MSKNKKYALYPNYFKGKKKHPIISGRYLKPKSPHECKSKETRDLIELQRWAEEHKYEFE